MEPAVPAGNGESQALSETVSQSLDPCLIIEGAPHERWTLRATWQYSTMSQQPHLPPGVVPEPAGNGRVSVWTFPRPPVVVPDPRQVIVTLGQLEICRTSSSVKVLETSHPPTWYLPMDAFVAGSLRPTSGSSVCEYKGVASYFDLIASGADDIQTPAVFAERAAWGYARPLPGYELLAGRVALYPGQVDSVTVDGERVRPQPGGFYGGWITHDVAGPFKGAPGTSYW